MSLTHSPSQPCACHLWCGDVPEEQDSPYAVCTGRDLPPPPQAVEIVMVQKKVSDMSDLSDLHRHAREDSP